MSRRTSRKLIMAANGIATGESSKELVAAPAAGYRLNIFYVLATCKTAAAQLIIVGESGGGVTKQIMTIPASGVAPVLFDSSDGFLLTAATALSAVPASAGPAWSFVIGYTIEKV